MSNKSKLQTDEAALTKALLKLIPSGDLDTVLVKAMDRLFADGKWEIPDDAIAGIVTNKVNQLHAKVDSLTQRMTELSAKISGTPIAATGRVNALEPKQPKTKKQ